MANVKLVRRPKRDIDLWQCYQIGAKSAWVYRMGIESVLVSYSRIIAWYDGKGLVTYGPAWKYSMTTCRHRNWFIRNCVPACNFKYLDNEDDFPYIVKRMIAKL